MHPSARMGTALTAVVVVMTATLGAAPPDDPTATAAPAAAPTPTPSAESPAPVPSQTPTPDETTGGTDQPPPSEEPTDEPATESPTPTPTATTPAVTPQLYVVLSVPRSAARPGDKVKASVHVYATGAVAKAGKLTVTATGGVTVSPTCTLSSGTCNLGDVTAAGDLVPVTLSVPANAAAGSVNVTAAVSARAAASKTSVQVLTVAAQATATATPSATPSAAPGTTSVPPLSSPYSALPPNTPQSIPSSTTDGGLPPIVAGASAPPVQLLDASQNVAAIRPGLPDGELDTLVRVQAVWLGGLLVLFGTLFLRLKRPVTGAHRRRPKGLFAR